MFIGSVSCVIFLLEGHDVMFALITVIEAEREDEGAVLADPLCGVRTRNQYVLHEENQRPYRAGSARVTERGTVAAVLRYVCTAQV